MSHGEHKNEIEAVRSAFRRNRLIWIPEYKVQRAEDDDWRNRRVRGAFYGVDDVVWEDPTFALDSLSSEEGAGLPRVLSAHYSHLRSFFVRYFCHDCLAGRYVVSLFA